MGDDSLDAVRWDLIREARQRIAEGYYFTPEVEAALVDRLDVEMSGTDDGT